MDQEFVVLSDSEGRVDFDLRSAWSSSMLDAFLASGADGLIANYARGFVGRDLQFLRGLPLRRLNVLARTVTDIAPVYGLADSLQELRVQIGSARIDLTALPNLRGLSCAWAQIADTIGDVTALDDVYLGGYDPCDLAPLAHLTELRSLRMKDRPALRSLDGVESLTWLAHLGIYLAPLEDTTALAQIGSPVLTELALASCRRINSLSAMSRLIGLRRLDLSEGGTIDSLTPIADLRLLQRLHLDGSTKIADGDLTPLLGMTRLADLRIMNRSHYAPSAQAVKDHLGLAR